MGKFLTYENSNWRTYVIDTTAETIKRPNRTIAKADLLGAIFEIDGEEVIGIAASESTTGLTAAVIVDGEITSIGYTFASDEFTLGETTLTNAFIDEYGREEMFI